jgi:sugar lactone lactonase YvrE
MHKIMKLLSRMVLIALVGVGENSLWSQTTYTPYAFTNFVGQPGGPGAANGQGKAARFRSPAAVAVGSDGNVYVSDQGNFTIRKISPDGEVTTIAGAQLQAGSTDGVGSVARFGSAVSGGPTGIALDSSNTIYVADTANRTIRKVVLTGTNWVVSTFAGTALQSGTLDGIGNAARFTSPTGMTTDAAGNIYVVDGFAIRRITPAAVVTTLAGSVTVSGILDGLNGAARFGSILGGPKSLAVDSANNIYVADNYNYTIRKVAPSGSDWVVTTIAGAPGILGFSDGANNEARFANPYGIAATGSGVIYVSDSSGQTIRKIVPDGTSWQVTTFAGSPTQLGFSDGLGIAARFATPEGMAIDTEGNVYVAELSNNDIRKITPSAEVTTMAGQSGGPGPVDGIGNTAQFDIPHSVAVDSIGNLFIGDTFNHTIRKVTPDGVVTTIAGSAGNKGFADGVGNEQAPQFNSPIGLSSDTAGNLYVTDNGNQTIRKVAPGSVVTTLAGKVGVKGSANGPSTDATFNSPTGSAIDLGGNLFVADSVNRVVRKITPGGIVSTFAGTVGQQGTNDGVGNVARFTSPIALAIDTGNNLYVADQGGNTIRKITPGGSVSTLAGVGKQGGAADGTGAAARFSGPEGVAVDAGGNVYVSDTGNQTVRKITPDGVVSTLAGLAGQKGGADGTNNAARFSVPRGIAVDRGHNIIYLSDSANSTIRKLVIESGDCIVTTLAGTVGENGSVDGSGPGARFHFPYGVAVDPVGNVYAVDRSNNDIRKITPNGVVTTYAGLPGQAGSIDGTGAGAQFYAPEGLAVDGSGNIFVSDYFNNSVRKIAPVGTNWIVTTIAGCPTCPGGTNDGPGLTARFNNAFGLTCDNQGNVYVADTVNKTIRKISPSQSEWVVTTFAGAPLIGGSLDGTGNSARFASPLGLAADANGIYVADSSTIRKITFDGVVSTLAGCPSCAPGSSDGIGIAALFWTARDIAVDTDGNLYVADSANHIVRKATFSSGQWAVTTLGGVPGQASGIDGVGSNARFNQPSGIAVDKSGNVFVVNTGENNLVKGTLGGTTVIPKVEFDTGSGALSYSNGTIQLRLTSATAGILVVEISTNLQSWLPIWTNPITPPSLSISLPTTNQNSFYRANLRFAP